MLQFRGLFEHLNPNAEKRDSRPAEKPKPKPRPKRFRLEGLAALRKKEDIIRSGVYERDKFVPPSGKGDFEIFFVKNIYFDFMF